MRLVTTSLALFAAACGGPIDVEPVPVVDNTPVEDPILTQCREANCAGVVNVEGCMVQECSAREPVISAGVKTIRFDEHTVFVELSPSYTPGGYGDIDAPRTAPIFVGVTAVTPSGSEIDLLVQELISDAPQAQVVFTAELDDRVDHVLIGLWERKITPCDSERNGCKEFGFLLDGSLATYPPNVYETGHRQRLIQEDITLRISATRSLDAQRVHALRSAIEDAARPVIDVYGVDLTTETSPAVDRPGVEVRYRHPRDIYLAGIVAERIEEETGIEPLLRYVPEGAQEDLQVTLGTDIAASPLRP